MTAQAPASPVTRTEREEPTIRNEASTDPAPLPGADRAESSPPPTPVPLARVADANAFRVGTVDAIASPGASASEEGSADRRRFRPIGVIVGIVGLVIAAGLIGRWSKAAPDPLELPATGSAALGATSGPRASVEPVTSNNPTAEPAPSTSAVPIADPNIATIELSADPASPASARAFRPPPTPRRPAHRKCDPLDPRCK